ncbi:hypothetical protein HG535_0D04820 [Zygotorulaspora mrakii]|uniref:EXS domain-containing protein n=1 Tax=Zygotorulaspora mrakii TaxID=42260 RepID=A0A7H9B2R2_ZYGMR|nr:uncharacterized protein HG535_0D04820 [Zygotorulaspora mrakii]QLG72773.1 hypothetical protein HG535_0D04820 [Zygotorulaspora mrakii]
MMKMKKKWKHENSIHLLLLDWRLANKRRQRGSMDGEKVSGELPKGWSLQIPPAERVNVLLLIAIWLWHWILVIMYSRKIDISSVLQTRRPDELKVPLAHSQLIRFSRAFGIKLSKMIVPLIIISVAFQSFDKETSSFIYSAISFLPLLQFVVILGFIWKDSVIIRYCTERLLLIEPTPRVLRNMYILLSDTLTSFGKPLVDFSLYLTALCLPQDSIWTHFDLLISLLPLIVRVTQCIREFYLTKDRSLIFNTIKYCSSIPIITYVWYSRVQPEKYDYMKHGWFLCLNSCYTFFWDIKMDWKFQSFFKIRAINKKHETMMFPRYFYYMGTLFNLLVKFWWIWTINGQRHEIFFANEQQYFEILRRSIWIIFKLESEFIIITKNNDEK